MNVATDYATKLSASHAALAGCEIAIEITRAAIAAMEIAVILTGDITIALDALISQRWNLRAALINARYNAGEIEISECNEAHDALENDRSKSS